MRFLKKAPPFEGGGLVIFLDVQDAILAEKVVKRAGYATKMVAPPPELRKGCDLALEVNLVEKPAIERVLDEEDVGYVDLVPINTSMAQLLDIVKVTDFGDWTMVKAGNMKLSFEKATGIIVNTSGGGCPDIPHLHAQMLDRKLTEAPLPKEIGFTLCALMLNRALEEALQLWQDGGRS